MLVPLSWLKEYVDIDVTPQELEKKLFDGGFEVEELYQVGHDIDKIVVGLVETCEPIPETHLHVCQVNAGENATVQIPKTVVLCTDIFDEFMMSNKAETFCLCLRTILTF